jgi:hypothetical protein
LAPEKFPDPGFETDLMIFSLSKKFLPLLLLPIIASAQNEPAKNPSPTTPEPPAPAKLDFKKFPGDIVAKVVVPVPAEVFAVLDKLDEPNWAAEINLPESPRISGDRVRLALLFGCTVAEGFIAVQAEDADSVQEVGRRVLRLAESLGLQPAVVPHCQSIIDSAGEGDWKTVREELDKTQQTVRTEMEQIHDDDLANLVSVGGWLRGTQTITSLISESYSTDKAELLNQPDLIRHFRDRVAELGKPVKEHGDVAQVREGLSAILDALAESSKGAENAHEISASTVMRIGEVCIDLLNRFYFEKKPEAPE